MFPTARNFPVSSILPPARNVNTDTVRSIAATATRLFRPGQSVRSLIAVIQGGVFPAVSASRFRTVAACEKSSACQSIQVPSLLPVATLSRDGTNSTHVMTSACDAAEEPPRDARSSSSRSRCVGESAYADVTARSSSSLGAGARMRNMKLVNSSQSTLPLPSASIFMKSCRSCVSVSEPPPRTSAKCWMNSSSSMPSFPSSSAASNFFFIS